MSSCILITAEPLLKPTDIQSGIQNKQARRTQQNLLSLARGSTCFKP